MTYTIELDEEFVDNIVVKSLTDIRNALRDDLEKVIDTDKGFVFSSDPVDDIHQISSLILSINNVLKYYSVPNHD